MSRKVTPAYIATINANHTIELPEEMPVGATVAVVLIPAGIDNAAGIERHERFSRTLTAITAAATPPLDMTDEDIDALIKQARKSSLEYSDKLCSAYHEARVWHP